MTGEQILTSSSIHICAAKIISILGPEHAILKPNRHLRIFIWTDIFAGTLQATGLGLIFANAEASRGSPKGIQLSGLAPTGQFIVYAGLLLQATSLLVGLCLLAMTYTRAGKASRQYGYTTFHKDAGYVPLSSRFKTFLVVLPLAAICVLVRTAYRAAGFFDGLDGAIASNEMVYLGAEGVMLTEAMASLAFFHPALWLDDGKDAELKDKDLQRRKSRDVEENLDEVSELILKTNLIAPSDASSSDGGSRRGSDAVSRHSEDITAAEARLVREEEDDHLEVVSIELPTRNPSRRVPGERDDNMEEVSLYSQVDEEEDRLEVVSIELPTRNPSKRVAGEEDSPYAQSVYSQ